MKNIQSLIAVLCVTLVIAPSGYGQQKIEAPTPIAPPKLRPANEAWYTRFTGRYEVPEIEPINLSNSNRLDQLIRAGRLYLSLQDAIALALENNLDVEIQRFGPRIAQTDLLRAQAGGFVRGLSSTTASSGPTSSSGASTSSGTTSTTTTNATNNINTSSGPAIPSLDEFLSINYNWAHQTSPLSSSFNTGTNASIFENGQFGATIQRGFTTGTNVSFGFNDLNQTSNNIRSEINPVRTANANLQITQHLLQGFGLALNTRQIRVGKNNIRVADLVFKQQVISTVASVINLYSDLVSFNENVKVNRQALALNEKLFNDNKKQVEIGTLAPIEIVRAEAEVARSQQDLTQSETQLLQQETVLKNYLSRNGLQSPSVADARVVPTDQLKIPDVEPVTPIQDLVEMAVQNRPELEQTRINLENSKINLSGSRSALLPTLDLVAGATNNGLAGQTNTIPIPGDQTGLFTRNPNPAFLGGFGTIFSQLFSRNYPNYNIGFQLNVPLRNRAAQADVARDLLNIRQAELRQRKELNQIRVDVQNALIGVQQSRAQYQAAVKSRVLQEQTLDAEQKKYALGASTIFFVIQAQRDLAQAQATEVVALSSYNRARVSLDSATGLILTNNNVSMAEAKSGKVARPASALPVLDQK